MSYTVTIQKNPKTGDNFRALDQVLDGTNIKPEDVSYYILDQKGDKLVLTLYNKNKKKIKVRNK